MANKQQQEEQTPTQMQQSQNQQNNSQVNINNIWDTPRNPDEPSPHHKENVDPQGFFEQLNYNGLINELI